MDKVSVLTGVARRFLSKGKRCRVTFIQVFTKQKEIIAGEI